MTRDFVGFKYMSDEEAMPSFGSLGPKIVSQGLGKVVSVSQDGSRPSFAPGTVLVAG